MKKVIKKRYIFILLILISIGFAYLTSNLSLSGISSIFKNTWDVHFENVVVSKNSVEAETPVIDINRTQVTFSVELDMPGDFYEFTVDAVNGGTIDSMLDTYTMTELTEEELKYLEYTVTYLDGENLAQYQELNAGDILTYKIKVEYKKDIEIEDLPEENHSLTLSLTTNYIQADENKKRRNIETHILYNVLKFETEDNGLAKKYTGEHQDSMNASLSIKDIYHWYANNDTEGTAITNKNNVIFANHCWQIIRTTDTGGTKLIYNGEVENNKCLNTRGNHIGYSEISSENLSDNNYYYGTDYNYDYTNNKFSISGTKQQIAWNDDNESTIIGKYTCKSTSETGTCEKLYLIESKESNTNANTINIDSNSDYSQFGKIAYNINSGSPSALGYMYNEYYSNESLKLEDIKEITGSISFGNSITDNNDGTYTINNATTLTKSEWKTNYRSYKNMYTCGSTSQVCANPQYTTYVESTNYRYTLVTNNFKYSVGIEYENNKYKLNNENATFWIIGLEELNTLNTHHYTCFNTTGECQSVYYIYFVNNSGDGKTIYYINLKNGKDIETAVNDMLYNNNVNKNNSTIKTGVEAWYQKMMLDYDGYIEDTIYCNDRTQSNYDINTWNPNSPGTNHYMFLNWNSYYFGIDPLVCENVTDRFSTENEIAKLKYKVGLITTKEMYLLNNNNARKTGQDYLTMNSSEFNNDTALVGGIRYTGRIDGMGAAYWPYGLRPVISLKPGTLYTSGNGSMETPYIIETN